MCATDFDPLILIAGILRRLHFPRAATGRHARAACCRATEKGLRQHPKEKWASLRTSYTAAFIAGMYATFPGLPAANATEAQCFVRSQLGYIAGDNPMGMSYVVGFGTKWPMQVHHRDTACTLREAVDNECYDQCAFPPSPPLPTSTCVTHLCSVTEECTPANYSKGESNTANEHSAHM